MAKKKYSKSLARRIVLIGIVLVLFPLILFTIVIWDRDWQIKLNTIFSEFELMGESNLKMYEQWLFFRTNQLEYFTKNLDDPSLSVKFILDEKFQTLFSTNKENLNFLPKVKEDKGGVFIALNPNTQKKEIFLVKRFEKEFRGLSVPVDQWIQKFIPNTKYNVSLIENKEIVFPAYSFDSQQTQIFSFSEIKDWEKKTGFFKNHEIKKDHLALRLSLPEANFQLQIELPNREIAAIEETSIFSPLLFILGTLILLGTLGAWVVIRRMAKPLYQLSEIMENVESKQYDSRYQWDQMGFEINTLGEQFNHTLETLLKNMEEAKNEKIGRELLAKELEIGRSVQKKLLPQTIPEFSRLEVGHGFLPAKEVAGDFYDLFAISENQVMIVIADGSGKGISACLYALIVRSLFRSFAYASKELSEVVQKTNALFIQDTKDTGNFVTAWLAYYDRKGRILHFTNSGHLPAILIHPDGKIEELQTEGIALGVIDIEDIVTRSINLVPGSIVFLYTDGLIESLNKKGEFFGKNRLLDFLIASYLLDPQSLIDKLFKEIHQFAEDSLQHDDLTALCFKIA